MARYHRQVGRKIIVRESPWWVRLLALFTCGLGILFVFAGLSGWSHHDDAPFATAVIIPAIGLFSIACAPCLWRKALDRKFTFDPDLKKAFWEMRSRGVVARGEVGFTEILTLEMEERRDDEDYISYRPVLRLAGGKYLPVREGFLFSKPCANGLKQAIQSVLSLSAPKAESAEDV